MASRKCWSLTEPNLKIKLLPILTFYLKITLLRNRYLLFFFFTYNHFIYICNYLGPETHMHLFHRLRIITSNFRKVATGKCETWFMLCFKIYIILYCFYDTNVLYCILVINEVRSKSFILFTRSRPCIHRKVTR